MLDVFSTKVGSAAIIPDASVTIKNECYNADQHLQQAVHVK